MNFQQAIKSVFSNYIKFEGRARRSEYWYWTLFNYLVSAVLSGVGGLISTLVGKTTGVAATSLISNVLPTLWAVAVILPSLSVCVRRLHDIGKSGWSYLIGLIPIVGWIILIVWFLQDSQKGANQYGDSEKYPSYAQPNPAQNPYAPQQQYSAPQQGQAQNYYAPQPQAVPQQNYYAPQPQQPVAPQADANGYYVPQQQQQPEQNNYYNPNNYQQ